MVAMSGLLLITCGAQAVLRFATVDLSGFYLDIAKDRLYISAADDERRRTCQTVLNIILHGFTKVRRREEPIPALPCTAVPTHSYSVQMIAPILPHMAEDIWLNLPYPVPHKSVFQSGWVEDRDFGPHRVEDWERILMLRTDVNKCLELARTAKLIGSSLESKVACSFSHWMKGWYPRFRLAFRFADSDPQ